MPASMFTAASSSAASVIEGGEIERGEGGLMLASSSSASTLLDSVAVAIGMDCVGSDC